MMAAGIGPARDQRGVALVELLVVIALLGVVTALLFTFLTTGQRLWQRGSEGFEQHMALRQALEAIRKDVRSAAAVTRAAENELVLRKLDGTEVRIRLDGQRLVRTAGGSDRTIAEGIERAAFASVPASRMVTITLRSTGAGESGPLEIQGQALRRNP